MGICVTAKAKNKNVFGLEPCEKGLREIFDQYKGKGDYDCIVAISGGKDKGQMHMLKNVYQLKPLAVTFNQNWHSEVGRRI